MSTDTNSLSFAETLLASRRAQATPWLVWHSAQGERIELSGRVFDNWVAKTANLLVDLFDVEPGSRIVLDLPAHWKSLVLALAAFQCGATVVDADHPEAAQAELWASDEPTGQRIPPAAQVLAVDLAALALQFGGELGPAEDYNATVRSFADTFLPDPVPGSTPALVAAGRTLSHAELFQDLGQAQGTILVSAELGLAQLLPFAIAQWSAGDALVLLGPGMEASHRLLAGERVTARYPAE